MSKLISNIFWIVVLTAICLLVLKIINDSFNKGNHISAKSENLKVAISYNTSTIGQRKVFGYAVPYGIVWRTGSDDATEIEFSEDCLFNGEKIKPGKYSLWSIPDPKKWVIILNKETGQYGTLYNPNRDYLRTTVAADTLSQKVKKLALNLDKAAEKEIIFSIAWENTKVEIPIKTLP